MNGSINDIIQRLMDIFSEMDFTGIDLDNIDNGTLADLYENKIALKIRKKYGQFYTPNFLVKFTLDLVKSNIKFNDNYLVLDPSCGSGSFLLEVYDIMKDIWLGNDKHETILRHIRGFEIDVEAAELAEVSLLLKDLNQKTKSVSPIYKTNFLDEQIEEKFDLIVGNPPYYLISTKQIKESDRRKEKQFHTTFFTRENINKYKKRFDSWPHNNRNPNISYLFVEKAIRLLKEKGYLVFILPDIILAGMSTLNLRNFILKKCRIDKIVKIKGKIFKNIGITNIIMVLQRCEDPVLRDNNKIEVIQTSLKEISQEIKQETHFVSQSIFYKNPLYIFSVQMNTEVCRFFELFYEKLGNNELTTLGEIAVIKRGIENLKKKHSLKEVKSKHTKRLITSSNVNKYRVLWDKGSFRCRYVEYDPDKYPNVNFKNIRWFEKPKIVLRRIERELICAYDKEKFVAMDSVQLIWLKSQWRDKYSLRVLVAILNSGLINFYYRMLFSYKQLFSKVQKIYLENLPVPQEIDFSIQREIEVLVQKLENEYKEETERELNRIIKTLYLDDDLLGLFDSLSYN
ncbi:MAG: N-6 DNA methylase [Candidatus Hodarchaeales archaeon]